jgi:uncharacterized protein YkwD
MPIAKPIISANYSDKLMIQLYFVSGVRRSGEETTEQVYINGQPECQTASRTESYTTENRLAAACTVYPDGAGDQDPRTQTRNSAFENKVLELVNYTTAAQLANNEISEEEVFEGGISIYIAGQGGSGPETDMLRLINEERELLGLYPLLPNNNLNSAAQNHAADMAANKLLSYTGSDGSTMQERFNSTGYNNITKSGNSSGATEYIASGYTTATALFAAFKASSSWDVIMNADYREMGASSEIDDQGKRYWSLTFGFNDEH